MSKTRNLSDLLDANGDVKSGALDNVPASDLVNDTSPQLGGDLASNGNDILLADNDKIKVGTGNDLEIYHNGSHSIIEEVGTGKLELRSNGTGVDIQKENAEFMARFITDGAVELYHDHSKKLETASGGVTITGTATATAFSGDGSALTNVPAGVSAVNTVVVTSTSTYTPTSGTKFVNVYATGGGGGAGGIVSNAASYVYGSSGAGGGGGTSFRTYNATELGANAAVTIGAGGGGANGNANGSTGGTTTFNPAGTGASIVGYGGGGGYGIDLGGGAIASGIAGRGGGASGGQLNMDGHVGAVNEPGTRSSSTINVQANTGGPSFFGGFNSLRTANNGGDSGQSANAFGAGGNGAVQHNSSTTRGGGNGKAGIVVIMEFA